MNATQPVSTVSNVSPINQAAAATKASFFSVQPTTRHRLEGAAAVAVGALLWKYAVRPIGVNAINSFQAWRANRAKAPQA